MLMLPIFDEVLDLNIANAALGAATLGLLVFVWGGVAYALLAAQRERSRLRRRSSASSCEPPVDGGVRPPLARASGARHAIAAITVVALALVAAAPALAGFSGTDVFLPSVGRKGGTGGSQWYTMLWIHNPSSSPANVTIAFLLRDQPNPSPATFSDTIPPGDSRRYPDTITTLFRAQAWGALRITSNVRVLATCRMYNLPAGGDDPDTQGQDYSAIPASFAISAGQSTKLLGVHQTNPKADSDFRYSFGWVETAGGTADVKVVAYDETGAQVASKTYPRTGVFEARYYPIEDLLASVNSTNLTLQVSVVSGTGKVIAVGSGVANRSGDGTTFEMAFADSLLGGTGGLTSVVHDATLTGDGTTAAPLAIAAGQVVRSVNGVRDDVSIAAGPNVTINRSGQTLTVAATGGGLTLPYVGTVSAPESAFDVTNESQGYAFRAVSNGAVALRASTPIGTGVFGDGSLAGVQGSGDAFGVRGISGYTAGLGVEGQNDTTGNWGALGSRESGVSGTSTSGSGVHGGSTYGDGVYGESGYGYGVHGRSDNADGVFGETGAGSKAGVFAVNYNSAGYAGYFVGNVQVNGTLSATGSKSFAIDHPLDPENRELWHAAVESDEVLDVYSGNVTTDGQGRAWVTLPEWFEALNADFRYQLTVIGRFARAIVEEEIRGNRFTVRTDLPDVKVSWQVTARRNDAWIQAHPFVVERDKPLAERGTYLSPVEHGQPVERGVEWVRRPELMRQQRADHDGVR
ncbi:MAG TPA: hypothetical protein VMT19_05350 [Thermoanaerobaculaceae bacterium]|nr:hypothetical protein [Thermoanaerobaculaceae bacterium]